MPGIKEKEWLHKTIQNWLGQGEGLATGTMTLSSLPPLPDNRRRWGSLATLVPIVLLIAVFFILAQKGIIQFFGIHMAKVAKQTTKGTAAESVCTEWIAGLRAEEDVARARLRHTDYANLSADQAHKKGLDHDRRREYADAIVAWEWEVAKNPNSTNGWNDIGYAYQVLDNPELALKYANKSTAIDPHFGHGHYTAGRALLIMGHFQEARDELQEAIKYGWQQNGDSQMLLGLALRELGDEEGARLAFRRSLDIRPDNAETKSYLSGTRFKPTWPDCHNRLTAPPDTTKAEKS
jgi:tetratricopeptide (TPR) repeat protein